MYVYVLWHVAHEYMHVRTLACGARAHVCTYLGVCRTSACMYVPWRVSYEFVFELIGSAAAVALEALRLVHVVDVHVEVVTRLVGLAAQRAHVRHTRHLLVVLNVLVRATVVEILQQQQQHQ